MNRCHWTNSRSEVAVQIEFHSGFFASITWLLPAALMFAGGCEHQATTVTGAITVDRALPNLTPDTRGTISFQPASGQGINATGLLNQAGEYQLSAGRSWEIEPGKYQVAISIVKLLPKSDVGERGAKQIIAAKYDSAKTSGLVAEVHPGPNVFNFDVSSSDEPGEGSADVALPIDSSQDKGVKTTQSAER
jgi:hypothetical protein